MDEVRLGSMIVDRVVLQSAISLLAAGAACGGLVTWRSTTHLTSWRMPRCALGACALGAATLVAGYVGTVVLYLAGALLPDAVVFAMWPLAIVAFAGVVWASARVLLPLLAAGRAP